MWQSRIVVVQAGGGLKRVSRVLLEGSGALCIQGTDPGTYSTVWCLHSYSADRDEVLPPVLPALKAKKPYPAVLALYTPPINASKQKQAGEP